MVEQNSFSDEEQVRWDKEDEILMQIVHENSVKACALEQAYADINARCESAKYRAYVRKVRRAYRNAAHAVSTLVGVSVSAAVLCLILGNAVGVFVTLIAVFGLVCLAAYYDRKSR